tara:strand:- start:3829 stop:4176 length:348 start_codon:yes stop_codon:yes gene_type:complete
MATDTVTLEVDSTIENTEEPTLTKAEVELRRKEITDYYKENIKHLKIQLEYETILKDIEKTRAERVQAQMFLAQASQGQQQGEGGAPSNTEMAEAFAKAQNEADHAPKRTLKREG